jgi:hypothetical protein
MLPTIEREPLRSTYSSATLKPFEPPLRFALDPPRPPLGWRADPLPSRTATRVSPASTETRILFLI